MPQFNFGSLIDKEETPPQDKSKSSKKSIRKISKMSPPMDLDSFSMSRLRGFYNNLYHKDPPHTSEWDKDKVRKAIIKFFENL